MPEPRLNTSILIAQGPVLRVLHKAEVAFVLTFIWIPIALTSIMAFNAGGFLSFPIQNFSLRWFSEFFSSPLWVDALLNSLLAASAVSLISTIAGASLAFVFDKHNLPRRGVCYFLPLLPLFMPGVVLGLSMLISFGAVLKGTLLFVILAHSLWAMPLVFMVMEATFRQVDRRVIEASWDLGATPARTFAEITLPMVLTGLVSSALFAFVVSLNEFIMALFLTTRETQTLPVLMWQSLRSAGTPILAVAALILMVIVVSALGIALALHALHRRQA